MADQILTVVDSQPAEAAMVDLRSAIEALPAAEHASQRVKFLTMFEEHLVDLFVIKMDVASAGPTHALKRSVLHPSQGLLDAISAVRAGELDWDIK